MTVKMPSLIEVKEAGVPNWTPYSLYRQFQEARKANTMQKILDAQAKYADESQQQQLEQSRSKAMLDQLKAKYLPEETEADIAYKKALGGLHGVNAESIRAKLPYEIMRNQSEMIKDPFNRMEFEENLKNFSPSSLPNLPLSNQQVTNLRNYFRPTVDSSQGIAQPSQGQPQLQQPQLLPSLQQQPTPQFQYAPFIQQPSSQPAIGGGNRITRLVDKLLDQAGIAKTGDPTVDRSMASVIYKNPTLLKTKLSTQEKAEVNKLKTHEQMWKKSLEDSQKSALSSNELIDEAERARYFYDQTFVRGPLLGRSGMQYLDSDALNAQKSMASLQAKLGKELSGNRAVTMGDWQVVKQVKPQISDTPLVINEQLNKIIAVAKRTQEYSRFMSAAYDAGMSTNNANDLWIKFAKDNPLFDRKTGQTNDENISNWENYLDPSLLRRGGKVATPSQTPMFTEQTNNIGQMQPVNNNISSPKKINLGNDMGSLLQYTSSVYDIPPNKVKKMIGLENE